VPFHLKECNVITEAITYDDLYRLHGKTLCIWGKETQGEHCIRHIENHHPEITIKFIFHKGATNEFCGYPVYNFESYCTWHDVSSLIVLIASDDYSSILREFIDVEVAEVYICSKEASSSFGKNEKNVPLQYSTVPFLMNDTTPKIPLIVSGVSLSTKDKAEHFFLADFARQEYRIYTCENVRIPLSLRDYSSRIRQSDLPLRMSHLDYLMDQRMIHVAQLSPSRRYITGQRNNFFHLDILDLEKDIVTRWHDRPSSEGLWQYVATADYDGEKEYLYFVRWPLEDAINGMINGSNKVHCEFGKLNLETLKAEILANFDFVDRIHQVTISGDKRYVVCAPMRVLRPPIALSLLKETEVMAKLQEWAILDDMATLDLHTGKVSFTKIPYPIPAHFELDPLEPHVFYVSTHSLVPHQGGVLIFNPGTIHRLRIIDGISVIEKTYTHPNFVRATQHYPFVFRGKTLIAATNQNKLELIDAETMTAWYIHRLLDDPLYDDADFTDPNFFSKLYSLPPAPAHCHFVAASADGEHLALRTNDCFKIFSMAEKTVVGQVAVPKGHTRVGHGRSYMQNSMRSVMESRYAEIWKK
jgi:hypothetical protein